jgi:hypothetical protein
MIGLIVLIVLLTGLLTNADGAGDKGRSTPVRVRQRRR